MYNELLFNEEEKKLKEEKWEKGVKRRNIW
jgi:hypothetical protein